MREACYLVSVTFVPMVVELLGGWSPGAAEVIHSIGQLQGQRLGIPLPILKPPLPEAGYLPLEGECQFVD